MIKATSIHTEWERGYCINHNKATTQAVPRTGVSRPIIFYSYIFPGEKNTLMTSLAPRNIIVSCVEVSSTMMGPGYTRKDQRPTSKMRSYVGYGMCLCSRGRRTNVMPSKTLSEECGKAAGRCTAVLIHSKAPRSG